MLEFINSFSFLLGMILGFMGVGILASALALDRFMLVPFLSASFLTLYYLLTQQAVGAIQVLPVFAGFIVSAALFAGGVAILGTRE